MGVWSTNYLFGNMLVKSLGGYLLGSWGWRWSFWGCTLLGFGVWWLLFFWQRNRPRTWVSNQSSTEAVTRD